MSFDWLLTGGVVCAGLTGAALYAGSPNQMLVPRRPPPRPLLMIAFVLGLSAVAAMWVEHSPATAIMMTVCVVMSSCVVLPLGCALRRGRGEKGRP